MEEEPRAELEMDDRWRKSRGLSWRWMIDGGRDAG